MNSEYKNDPCGTHEEAEVLKKAGEGGSTCQQTYAVQV